MTSDLDAFIGQFSGTKSYWFYNNTVELRYEHKKHVYYLVTPEGLVAQDGVTDTCQIIDKSMALVPWACNMMAQKLLDTAPVSRCFHSNRQFEEFILAAKSAHKEKLDQAAYVGNMAHDWIETYIKGWIANHASVSCWAFDVPRDNEQVTNCCLAALDWMTKHNVRWISTETKVYSINWGFAGTLDGLCYVDSCGDIKCCRESFKNRLSIADWKSSNELRTEYLLQTAAYMYAYHEEHADAVIVDRWVIRLGKDDGEFDPWHLEGDSYYTDWRAFREALGLKRTLAKIEARMKERAGEIRQVRKEERKEAREEALSIKCNGADKYKGIRKPACNGGNPCQSCIARYAETHPV